MAPWGWIICWSYVGAGTRIGLEFLSEYINTSIVNELGVSYFLANIFGCFIMGLAKHVEDYELLSVSKHAATGLTTGFCGACTTFATWLSVVGVQYVRGAVLNPTLNILINLSLALVSYHVGYHSGFLLQRALPPNVLPSYRQSIVQDRVLKRLECQNATTWSQLEPVVVSAQQSISRYTSLIETLRHQKDDVQTHSYMIFAGGVVIGLVFLLLACFDPQTERRRVWAALVCAPAGAASRFFLSQYNRCNKTFPVFTLLVNVVASAADSIILATDEDGIWIHGGIMTGYLGSLSTVSTFIHEIVSLNRTRYMYGYRYALVSVATASGFCIFFTCWF